MFCVREWGFHNMALVSLPVVDALGFLAAALPSDCAFLRDRLHRPIFLPYPVLYSNFESI
jgi:hypothetical protein